jgi:hypothetical protein
LRAPRRRTPALLPSPTVPWPSDPAMHQPASAWWRSTSRSHRHDAQSRT